MAHLNPICPQPVCSKPWTDQATTDVQAKTFGNLPGVKFVTPRHQQKMSLEEIELPQYDHRHWTEDLSVVRYYLI